VTENESDVVLRAGKGYHIIHITAYSPGHEDIRGHGEQNGAAGPRKREAGSAIRA
jgi:hypothetical protein